MHIDTLTSNILFLDIETVPQAPSVDDLDEEGRALWQIKAQRLNGGNPDFDLAESYAQAGIYAEFGKIICIAAGYVEDNTIFTTSYYGDDERQLLDNFASMLRFSFSSRSHFQRLCGHNIKEFDVPYIARRMIVNDLPLPHVLDVAGKKPWEVNFIDTIELWRFGDYKSYTPLRLLAHILGVPTPKDDIDGSQVARIYYEEHDLARIALYCEKDVVATARIFQRMRGEAMAEKAFHKK